jgi:hypothetical protein
MSRATYFSNLAAFYKRRPFVSLLAGCGGLGLGTAAYWAPLYYADYWKPPILNPSSFTPYTLIYKHRVSATSSIFTLRPVPPSDRAAAQLRQAWDKSATLWSVQAKQPQLQIGREYTPLPPSRVLEYRDASGGEGDNDADIHLLIRKEKKGEMTTYLHGLPMQATVHLRGPYQDVKIPPHVDEVLFLAGGTGISPALQVAHILSRREGTKMHILWANRRREECLGGMSDAFVEEKTTGLLSGLRNVLGMAEAKIDRAMPMEHEKGTMVRVVQEMQKSAPPHAVDVQYFIDEEDTFIGQRHIKKILKHTNAVAPDAQPGAKLILVSGPDGFVDYWAGKKRFQSGQETQGPLGGILGEMDLNGWKVWKV